jgi:hypothetical protein
VNNKPLKKNQADSTFAAYRYIGGKTALTRGREEEEEEEGGIHMVMAYTDARGGAQVHAEHGVAVVVFEVILLHQRIPGLLLRAALHQLCKGGAVLTIWLDIGI